MTTAEITGRPADDQFGRVDEVKRSVGRPIEPGDDRWWILGVPMTVLVDEHEVVVVPTGFTSDGASIPRAAQLLTSWKPWQPPQRWGGIVHDWLYHQPAYSKSRADDVFLAVLKAENAPWFRARVMYLAVKLFGRKAYDANQQRGPGSRIFL